MFKNKRLFLGGAILSILIIVVALAPIIATKNPLANVLEMRLVPPTSGAILGTDHLGRDVFARIIYGGRITISISLVISVISMVFGTVLGLIAGYYRGIADGIVMTMVEVLLAFPSVILSLAVVGILGVGTKNMVFAICIVSWIGYAKLVRGLVLSISQKDFVKSGIICGSSSGKILKIHIFPNVINQVIIYSATHISSIIMQVASLSFLGLGVQAPVAEWGNMLNDAKGYMTTAPWLVIAPAIAVIVLVVGCNLFGEGLAQYINSKKTGGD